jgi:plasmid stabilization system protein ParE
VALTLEITAQARRDSGRILAFIARQNPAAARNLANALEEGILRLCTYPFSGPACPNRISPDIRQLVVPSCRILYRVAKQKVYILGVMRCEQDLKQDPSEGS